MFDFIKKKFSELKDTQDTKYITKLITLLAPLTDTIPILVIIKNLTKKQKKLIRNNVFIWGYLNNLTMLNAKKLSIQTTNHAVLLTTAQELYASMFLIDVEIAKEEYTTMHKKIKDNKLFKEEFAKGAESCRMDMEEINIEVPNRMHSLQRLHRFLNEKVPRPLSNAE
tara:strand:- start:33 stop:536 length:504 start_codon:yes stop_codon:yes gene_type:complete